MYLIVDVTQFYNQAYSLQIKLAVKHENLDGNCDGLLLQRSGITENHCPDIFDLNLQKKKGGGNSR